MESEIRAAWTARQLSTEPIDRPAAETAISELYEAAGFEPPRHFFWFDSPWRARTAMVVLAEPHCPWRRIAFDEFARTQRGREYIDDVRRDLCQRCDLDWDGVCAEVGDTLMFHWETICPGSRRIMQPVSRARKEFYSPEEPPAIQDGRDDSLRQTQSSRLWEFMIDAPIEQDRSFDGWYNIFMMGKDEGRALQSPAPLVLRAAWKAAHLVSDPWWPMLGGVVLTERPAEIHRNEELRLHRVDGPALVYRDGLSFWAFDGEPVPENWMLQPEVIPAEDLRDCSPAFREYVKSQKRKLPRKPKLRLSPILKMPLPMESAERVMLLRKHNEGRLPLFDRYLAGDYQTVWDELVALGPSVREDPLAADALAVAYEIASRVGSNVRTITGRLSALAYKFAERKPYSPPEPKTAAQVARLEKKAGTLPLFLRAFYEVVGAVDWTGQHPVIAPPHDSHAPDPLVVYPVGDALKWWSEEAKDGVSEIVIAPDAIHKGGESGDRYTIGLPNLHVDGPLLGEDHELLFVDYLRLVFRFGGFAGYDGVDPLPTELAGLGEGLYVF
jgi:hypothetical protein